MLLRNTTVRGAVIRNVKPYSSPKARIAGVPWNGRISAKMPIRITKHSAVGREAPKASAITPGHQHAQAAP